MQLKLGILLATISLLVLGLFLDTPSDFGVCYQHQVPSGVICIAPYAQTASLLLPFSLALLLSSTLVFFTTRRTFRKWAWFTLWYGIVAGILMYLAAMAGIDDGGFVSIPLFDVEEVAQWLASIYGIISVILLGISDFLVRRKK